MRWTYQFFALAVLAAVTTGPASAEPSAGPPAWDDRASVYLSMGQKAAAEDAATNEVPNSQLPSDDIGPAMTTAARVQARPIVDPAVTPAAHAEPIEATVPPSDSRHLAPPSARSAPLRAGATSSQNDQPASTASRRLAEFGLPMQSLYTVFTALAIVIGAFLLFAWALRRSGRAMRRRGQLPAEVVSVLGRVPLAAKQFAELLRVGNKLVLVSLTPTGAETLTEVTDPAEVDRLLGLCQQNNPFSTTKAFEQVFQQMSTETAPAGFIGNEPMLTSLASPAGAYRANRGGGARG
jgi:flagellar biogenesis protein FliO